MKIPKRILLIEDDEDDQLSFIDALNTIGNTTLQYLACNGKEALDYLSKTQILPHLIFSDINMPLVNGIECLKKIIENPLTGNIPVVIISTDKEGARVAMSLGASAYIDKQSEHRYLHQKIEQAIDNYTVI